MVILHTLFRPLKVISNGLVMAIEFRFGSVLYKFNVPGLQPKDCFYKSLLVLVEIC